MTATGPAAPPPPARTTGGAPRAGEWGTDRIRVAYGETLALDGVSLRARPGAVTAVVGGDGAGRTTLLRCLAGVITPSEGSVSRPPVARIGYAAAGSGTYPDLSVADNLAFRAAVYRLPPAAARERAARLTGQVGLADASGRLAGNLSGGMRQKLGVVAAMLHQPSLLVLDEPTTGVDPVSRSDLWWLIASAAADGAAVVLATSYLDEAERAAEVLVLDAGRVLGCGTPERIVAAMPGALWDRAVRPAGALGWRRGARWRVWEPGGTGGDAAADLRDAVTVAALAHEPAGGVALAEAPAARDHTLGAAAADETAAGAAPSPVAGAPGLADAPALAECVRVSRRFGQFTAVDDVSLRVAPGEIVGLLGANGAGKTTLIRLLLGLLPATGGEVRLFGLGPSRRTRRRIGYVPQGLGLYDDLTAAENLAFAGAVFGDGGGALPATLAPFARRTVGSLPLGAQRGVAFTQALAHDPDLLILDEPTSGVAPLARARLWESVGAAARAGAGVLISTHYMDEAAECDRLLIMAQGAVVAEGPAAAITRGATVRVVETADWASAFAALAAAGVPASLAGRALRVPVASADEVRAALSGVPAVVSERPASLEERFFQLTLRDPAAGRVR